jgi:hypothetical protein
MQKVDGDHSPSTSNRKRYGLFRYGWASAIFSRVCDRVDDLNGQVRCNTNLTGQSAGFDQLRLFECFFFSVLNFSFFGFGDVTPQTIQAKIVTMMEVILAFFTVIFLLSDFISLKDSLREDKKPRE